MQNRNFKKAAEKQRDSASESRGILRVSSRSAWTDLTWDLDNPSPGQISRIGWDFLLPDGSRSTAKKNFELLESFREIILGMIEDGGWYGRTLKPGSTSVLATGARHLFRWMVFRGLRSINELDSAAQQRYLDDIPFLIVCGDEFYGHNMDNAEFEPDEEIDYDEVTSDVDVPSNVELEPYEEEADGSQSDLMTWGKVRCRIIIFYAAYAQGHRLKKRGFGSMFEEPFGGKKITDVTAKLTSCTVGKTPPLPDEVAAPLLSKAIEWVLGKSEDVIALQKIHNDIRDNGLENGHCVSYISCSIRKALMEYEFSAMPGSPDPWRAKLEKKEVHVVDGKFVTHGAADFLRYSANRTRDACIILLMYLVGLRPGEICGIKGGLNEETGLPSCIEIRYSRSGLLEMFYLRSIVSKGKAQPSEAEWLLACRPVGSIHIPLTLFAVIVLQRLFSPWRRMSNMPLSNFEWVMPVVGRENE
ncbi:hypothetical protein LMG28614_06942 [Paraburkholderia ultramafica]|uniref:Tyr recombinase domain-containing protein n=1 Tax=Paraburkholderia ultramafica TaxID=1544867 RepID=A0A6S7BRA4_9BURK|nr:hypothetical protein [Paraburkholderia ultramafica]CAB3809062.1 hypothetical protein LMG28614_06942 [Paraburkholderia ultramafica]